MYKISFKTKFNIYKKFNYDLWGYYSNMSWFLKKPKITDKIAQYFFQKYEKKLKYKRINIHIYIVDKFHKLEIRRKINQKFLKKIVIKFYYINIKYHQFRAWGVKAMKRTGFSEGFYILYLEGRVSSILYRMNFIYNVFWLKWIVNFQGIFVNKKRITFTNTIINLFDIIQINKYLYNNIRVNLLRRIFYNLIFFNTPRFFIINYNLLFGFCFDFPNKQDIIYPSSIDIYRGLDFI